MTEIVATVIFEATENEPAYTRVFRFEFETADNAPDNALVFLDTIEDVPGLLNAEELTTKRLSVQGNMEVFDGGSETIEPIFSSSQESLIRACLEVSPRSCYAVDRAGNTLQHGGTWQIAGKAFT